MNIEVGNGIVIVEDKMKVLLDPLLADFISFVSHAHLDHTPKAILKKPFTTKETLELIKVRDPSFSAKTVEMGKENEYNSFSFSLISANHILGSSQILIESEEKRILYTGDIKLTKNETTLPLQAPDEVDILIIESTFGLPKYVFPSLDEIISDLITWIEKNLFKGRKIVIGAYPLGKAQEVIKILNKNGIIPKTTRLIEKYNKVYRKFGIKLKTDKESEVMVKPMHEVLFKPLKNSANCVVTGWALTEKFENVKGFPLSDHADFIELLSYIEEVKPKEVYVTHGFAEEFASHIKKLLGIKTRVLKELKL